jgi:rRNA-processing protein FCF1
LLELSDLLPRDEKNKTVWARIERLSNESTGSESFEAALERSDGEKIECIITLNPISLEGRSGIILLAKEVSSSSVLTADVSLETETEALRNCGSLLFLLNP